MYRVVIHMGAHYRDPIACQYKTVGSISQIREGARVKCQQLLATRNKRTWVDLQTLEGAPVTHWNFDEGMY